MKANALRGILLWLLGRVYRIKFDGKDNLKALRDHLEEGSVILVFNHLSFDDAVVLLRPLFLEAKEVIERVIVPGSRKHWGEPLFGQIMRLGPLSGIEVFPAVQHYERGADSPYSRAHIFLLDWRFGKAAGEVLGMAGGVILFAPEGTRSKDGKIQPPQKGIGFLIRLAKRRGFRTKIMPIGIEPQEGFSRDLNFGKEFSIHFGPLLSLEEIENSVKEKQISSGEIVMEEIADLLPAGYSS